MSNQTSQQTAQQLPAGKLRFGEKLGYGAGDLASNLVWTAAATFLTFFYTDVIGIAAGAVGTLMLIARILDAFIDIGVGVVVDKTKTRFGKARPWLLWMAIPFGLAGFLLFTVPNASPAGTILYAYITYIVMNVIYSTINVPYGVLNSLMTQDPYQRSVLNIFRMVMALIGGIIVNFFTMPLINSFGGGQTGWVAAFAVFGILAACLFLVTFFSTKERITPSVVQKEVPMKRGFKALFRNKYWGLMLVYAVVFYMGMGVGSGMNVYFAQYVLNNSNLVGILGVGSLIPMLIGLLFIAPVIKRFGKRNASLAGSAVAVVGSLIMAINPSSLTVIMIGLIVKSLGMVPIIGTIFAMLADTVDYGEWKTGIRTEGLVYSAGSFGTKAGSGLGAAIIGWALAIAGYVGGQDTVSASATSMISFLFVWLPGIMAVIQVIILWFYKLDKDYPQIIKDLNEVKQM